MIFSIEQIKDLLHTIDTNTNVFIANSLGANYLTKDEIENLKNIGIDAHKLYNEGSDLIKQSFLFGLISDSLGKDAKNIKFEDLKKYFKSGSYIPLTKVEEYSLDSIKNQSLKDIRANKERIFRDIHGIIHSSEKNDRLAYENVIREEVKEGLVKNKTVAEIARELGRKTGDWNRDFRKSVSYISHLALNEGRVAASYRKDPNNKVYFDVFPKACKSCVKNYLTNGAGSKPKLFTIEQIKRNGDNIGKKQIDWLPTLGPQHVYCRCLVQNYRQGTEWDEKLKRFELIKEIKSTNRPLIKFKITINGKEKEYSV